MQLLLSITFHHSLMFYAWDLLQIGASISFDASSMNELRQWNDKYGEGGSRKKSNFGFS